MLSRVRDLLKARRAGGEAQPQPEGSTRGPPLGLLNTLQQLRQDKPVNMRITCQILHISNISLNSRHIYSTIERFFFSFVKKLTFVNF